MTEGERDQFYQELAGEASQVYVTIQDVLAESDLPPLMMMGLLDDLKADIWHEMHSGDMPDDEDLGNGTGEIELG